MMMLSLVSKNGQQLQNKAQIGSSYLRLCVFQVIWHCQSYQTPSLALNIGENLKEKIMIKSLTWNLVSHLQQRPVVQLHVQVLLTASTAQLRRVDRQAAIQLTATQHQVATSMFIFREVQPRRENGTKKTVAFIVVNFLQTV